MSFHQRVGFSFISRVTLEDLKKLTAFQAPETPGAPVGSDSSWAFFGGFRSPAFFGGKVLGKFWGGENFIFEDLGHQIFIGTKVSRK